MEEEKQISDVLIISPEVKFVSTGGKIEILKWEENRECFKEDVVVSQELRFDSMSTKVEIFKGGRCEELLLPSSEICEEVFVVPKAEHNLKNPFDICCQTKDILVREEESYMASVTKNFQFKFAYGSAPPMKDIRTNLFTTKFRNAIVNVISKHHISKLSQKSHKHR